MMTGQEQPGAEEPGLNFVQNENRAVAPAKGLSFQEIVRRRDKHAAFGLHRLDDERREGLGAKLFLQLTNIAIRNEFGGRQHRSESSLPEVVRHQGKRATGEAVESAGGAKDAWAFGMGAREFDCGFNAFAAGAAKECLADAAPGEPAKPRR